MIQNFRVETIIFSWLPYWNLSICVLLLQHSVGTVHTGRNVPRFLHINTHIYHVPNTKAYIGNFVQWKLDLCDTGIAFLHYFQPILIIAFNYKPIQSTPISSKVFKLLQGLWKVLVCFHLTNHLIIRKNYYLSTTEVFPTLSHKHQTPLDCIMKPDYRL